MVGKAPEREWVVTRARVWRPRRDALMRNLTTKSDQNSKRVSVLSKMPSYTLTASVTMPRPEMTYSMNVTMKNMTVLSTPSAEQDLTPQSWKQPAKNAGIVERVMTTIKRMMPTVQKTRLTRSEAMSKMSKEIAYQSNNSSLYRAEGGRVQS